MEISWNVLSSWFSLIWSVGSQLWSYSLSLMSKSLLVGSLWWSVSVWILMIYNGTSLMSLGYYRKLFVMFQFHDDDENSGSSYECYLFDWQSLEDGFFVKMVLFAYHRYWLFLIRAYTYRHEYGRVSPIHFEMSELPIGKTFQMSWQLNLSYRLISARLVFGFSDRKVFSIGICYSIGMWSQRYWYVTPIGD